MSKMNVQVDDVWEATCDVTDVVTVHAIIGDEAVCSYLRHSYTRSAIIGIRSLAKNKLISCMVDGKRVDRPEAGDPCILTDCLLFRIGTKEEWLAADGEPPILDANGELPKPIEDSEPSVVCATVRDADGEIHIECRFDNGEKFAAVIVDGHLGALAKKICYFLNNEAKEK